MTQLFTNNATSSLAVAVAVGDLSITLKTGEGVKFPAPTTADYFLLTLYQKPSAVEINYEIMRCTARSGDVLTVVRAQESTTATAYNIADAVELRATAGTLTGKQDLLVSGTNIKTVNGASVLTSGDLALGDVFATGIQTLTNKTITETVFAVTGTTPALTATNGAVQTWTLTAASTPTSALTSGQSIILQITPGAFSITWPSVVFTKVGGSGVAPTLFSAGKTTIVLFRIGTVLYGSILGDTV